MRARAIWGASTVDDVTSASRATALVAGKGYLLCPTVDIWFKAAPAAGSIVAGAAGTHLCGAYDTRRVQVTDAGQSLYYIRVGSTDGKIAISDVTE